MTELPLFQHRPCFNPQHMFNRLCLLQKVSTDLLSHDLLPEFLKRSNVYTGKATKLKLKLN